MDLGSAMARLIKTSGSLTGLRRRDTFLIQSIYFFAKRQYQPGPLQAKTPVLSTTYQAARPEAASEQVIVYTAHKVKIWHLRSWQISEELKKTLTHSTLGLPAFPGLSEPSASLAYFIVMVPDIAERFQKSFNIPSTRSLLSSFESLLTKGIKKENCDKYFTTFPNSHQL